MINIIIIISVGIRSKISSAIKCAISISIRNISSIVNKSKELKLITLIFYNISISKLLTTMEGNFLFRWINLKSKKKEINVAVTIG